MPSMGQGNVNKNGPSRWTGAGILVALQGSEYRPQILAVPCKRRSQSSRCPEKCPHSRASGVGGARCAGNCYAAYMNNVMMSRDT